MASMLSSRSWGTAAAVVGFVMSALYLSVITGQGTQPSEYPLVAAYAVVMLGASVCAFVSSVIEPVRPARILLWVAAALFAMVGVLGILTIGVGFVIAAVLAVIGATRLTPVVTTSATDR